MNAKFKNDIRRANLIKAIRVKLCLYTDEYTDDEVWQYCCGTFFAKMLALNIAAKDLKKQVCEAISKPFNMFAKRR